MEYFAQNYTVDYNQTYSTSSGKALGVYYGILAVFAVVYIIAGWKIFTKAGQAGWKILIPIYNTVITLRIVGMSGWFVLLFLVPFVNFILAVVVAYKLAKAFGYGVGMTILEFIFGIGSLIIAFGNSKYHGPNGQGSPKAEAGSKPSNPTPQPPTPPPAKPTRPLVQ